MNLYLDKNDAPVLNHNRSIMKRKFCSESHPKEMQRLDNMPNIDTLSSNRALADRSHHISNDVDFDIIPGSLYYIDKRFLSTGIPDSLQFVKKVLVKQKDGTKVTVSYPSLAALQSYFGRIPHATKYSRHGQDHMETRMGTSPAMVEDFVMLPEVAVKALTRSVTYAEFAQKAHLWNFWVTEDPQQIQETGLSLDEWTTPTTTISASKGDVKNYANNELGAAEGLIQLIPASNGILNSNKNSAVEEPSEHTGEGPFGCQIKRGMRSVRRTLLRRYYTTYSINVKDDQKRNEEPSSKRSLDYNVKTHHNAGPSRPTYDQPETEVPKCIMHPFSEQDSAEAKSIKRSGKERVAGSKQAVSPNTLKLPKETKGRWAIERYKAAQLKLIEIMRQREAMPGNPILRPALREEARKDIGDTGLLDHLLKHMTDTVVGTGERFRRRHNTSGAMEYWLEDASFMELRRAAGIEDPFWIPPPGWKPGDEIFGQGGYGYRTMTSSEAAAMQKLKDTIQNFISYSNNAAQNTLGNISSEVSCSEMEDPAVETTNRSNFEVGQQTRGEPVTINEGGSTWRLEKDLVEMQQSLTLIQKNVQRIIMHLITAAISEYERGAQTKGDRNLQNTTGFLDALQSFPVSSPQPNDERRMSALAGQETTKLTMKTSSEASRLSGKSRKCDKNEGMQNKFSTMINSSNPERLLNHVPPHSASSLPRKARFLTADLLYSNSGSLIVKASCSNQISRHQEPGSTVGLQFPFSRFLPQHNQGFMTVPTARGQERSLDHQMYLCNVPLLKSVDMTTFPPHLETQQSMHFATQPKSSPGSISNISQDLSTALGLRSPNSAITMGKLIPEGNPESSSHLCPSVLSHSQKNPGSDQSCSQIFPGLVGFHIDGSLQGAHCGSEESRLECNTFPNLETCFLTVNDHLPTESSFKTTNQSKCSSGLDLRLGPPTSSA